MKNIILTMVLILAGCGSSHGANSVPGVPDTLANVTETATTTCPSTEKSSEKASEKKVTEEPQKASPSQTTMASTQVSTDTSTSAVASSSAVSSQTETTLETKALKLTSSSCVDPLPAEIKKGVKFTLCNGSLSEGTMEQTVTQNVTTVVTTSYQQCASNGQTDCIANATYSAYDGSNLTAGNIKRGTNIAGVSGSYSCTTYESCSANGQTGCLATANYPANNLELANLTPANIRSGVTIGSVVGTYNPVIESHNDCTAGGQTGCIATASFPTEAHNTCSANGQTDCALVSPWKAIGGVSYSNITSTNIKTGVVIAGVTGSVIPAVAPNQFDIRKDTVVNGITGLLQTRCRNSEATAPAEEKCSTIGWLELSTHGTYIWYSDRMSGLQWYKLGAMNRATAASQCAGLDVDGGGWRLPSKEELQQATLNRIQSVNGLKLDLDIIGYWSSYGGTPNGSIVSYDGSISSVLSTSTNVKALCVK